MSSALTAACNPKMRAISARSFSVDSEFMGGLLKKLMSVRAISVFKQAARPFPTRRHQPNVCYWCLLLVDVARGKVRSAWMLGAAGVFHSASSLFFLTKKVIPNGY